jgi:protein TonB
MKDRDRWTRTKHLFLLVVASTSLASAGCGGPDEPGFLNRLLDRTPQPDSLQVMLNVEPPFRYPTELYAQRVQGNVSLRLFIDQDGKVHNDSTRVAESSGHAALDSAALAGAAELRFAPASRRGRAMAVTIIYPVYFRHPEAQPLPGDTGAARKARKGDTT